MNRFAIAFAIPFAAVSFAHGQGNLAETLAKLDASSAKFTNAQADVHNVSYNYVLKDVDDDQHGSIYFIREKGGTTQMGLKTEGKEARTVEYRSGTLRVFNPGPKCFDTVRKPGIETYLTLGFGGSGKDLAQKWEINDLGAETIDGIKVEKLDLTPKDPAVKANISKFTLWLDLSRAVSLKQVLVSASRDTRTATYTNIRVNGKIDTKPFEFKGSACSK